MSCGGCVAITQLTDGEGQVTGVRIDHYDNPILVSAELLDDCAANPEGWAMHFDPATGTLELRAVNIHLTYQVTGYLPPDQRPPNSLEAATLRGTLVAASKPAPA